MMSKPICFLVLCSLSFYARFMQRAPAFLGHKDKHPSLLPAASCLILIYNSS